MSHQNKAAGIVVNHQAIKQVVDWLLRPALFVGVKVRGGATWKPRMVAAAAMVWALASDASLTERFQTARKVVAKIFRWHVPPGETYQGFMKMLRKWHIQLMLLIPPHVRELMRQTLPDRWEIAGFVVFAGDGSRVELPRTQSLEDAFAPPKKKPNRRRGRKDARRGRRRANRARQISQHASDAKHGSAADDKKRNSPQMWLTLFWHVGTGLPWAWRTGPSNSSERGQLTEMLAELPDKSLISADAGFVGYDFWTALLDAGHHFVIRVGANVTLLKQLGYARQHDHTVYLWPDAAAKKKQPPLVLRLIVVHDGKEPAYLVTDLPKSRLSDRAAATIYAARWGIELFFRTFKQTFDRTKLRSRSAANAQLELDWSLLTLWCVCVVGQRELAAAGAEPARLSAAAVIRAFQSTLRDYRLRPLRSDETLWAKLRAALRDDYRRTSSKTSRNYPRKKQRHATGAPNILHATKQQTKLTKELASQQPNLRLTA